ncbi:thiamine pyrophosphate-dependent enzyme [Chloroflexota bacterium]
MNKVLVAGLPKLWSPGRFGGRHCPGCHDPILERIICEVIEELGIEGETIQVNGIGCASRGWAEIDVDSLQTAHGRTPNAASAIKRIYPDRIVFTMSGDGDCCAIGMESLMQAALYGEKISTIMVNNTQYGTTGGQMGPTTMVGQITTTTQEGRKVENCGYPLHAPELLANIKGVAYTARGAVNSPANFGRTRKYIKTAFQKQIDRVGFSFIEVLSACPVNWHMTPVEATRWLTENMLPEFPLGEFKDVDSIED